MDNLAQSVDGGHSRKRLHPGRPPPGPGCPPPPYNGGTPPNPRRATARPTLNFSRSPKTARGWASGMDNRKRLPTPPPSHPCRNPLLLDDRGSGGPVREGAPGGAAQGSGACRPTRERPRRGPEAGGAVFIRPPWGGLILVSPRVRGRRLSQISIVGHYAYENRPATLLPWASIPAHRGIRAPWLQAARPAAQMVGARDRRRGHARA